MTYRALLVGNSIFEADAGLNPLNAPTKDVARLHGALVDAETGLFEEDHLRLVTERKRDEILDEIDDFFASGERDDLMLFYYSGHGVLDEGNQLYLCGRDTRSDRLPRTGIRDSEINNFIQAAASRRTILILDCCHSGTFKGGSIGHQLGGPGRYLIASTRGAALANDSQSPTGTSVFTERLVEGLLGGATDSNQDGLIDLREIYEYIKRRLTTENSKQIPYSRFDGDGDISLARTRPLPAIAIATDPGRNSDARAPSFGLSENVITLRDVDPQERLLPEIIEIVRFTDSNMDIVVEVLDPWLTAVVHGDRLTVTLTPHEGNNRGKVMVRDRITGSVQTLRVEAFVRQRPGNAKSLASSPAADRVTPEPRAGPTQPNPTTPRHPRNGRPDRR